MTDFTPAERATSIREPSTANLMIDSRDRTASNSPTAWNFSISRPNSILNGFFTRIGTTEVVLEWNLPNISSLLQNNTISIDVSGGSTYNLTLPDGNYSVQEALDTIVALANTASGGTTFSVTHSGQQYYISNTTAITIGVSTLSFQLGLGGTPSLNVPVIQPDLRSWRYLDFISSQLTYNQELKDSSTNPIVRDVLCRWYMSWDNPAPLDNYGFPILMSYKAFTCRRLFSPPKQIKWDSAQPIGQITFEVYGYATNGIAYPTGVLLSEIYPSIANNYNTDWLMTLQVSEV